MHALLQFLWSESTIEKIYKIELSKMYDSDFVAQFCQRVKSHQQEVEELIQHLSGKSGAVGGPQVRDRSVGTKAAAKGKTTVVEPFNLTAPKPRAIPPPKVYNTTFTAQPIPESHYHPEVPRAPSRGSRDSRTVAQKPFTLRTDRRPSNLARIQAEVEAQREAELQFDAKYARPAPKHNNSAPVRMTLGAVLREENNLRRKQAAEAAQLKQFEQDLRDASEYEKWRAEKAREEELARIVAVEETKERIAQASVAAQRAKLLSEARNQMAAAALDAEMAQKLAENRKKNEDDERKNRKKAEEMALQLKSNVEEAQRKMKEEKKMTEKIMDLK